MDSRGLSTALCLFPPLLSLAMAAPAPEATLSHPSNFIDEKKNLENSKLFLDDIKNDLSSYIANAALLSPDTYKYYLSLPEKLAASSLNLSLDSPDGAFAKNTLGNLALIGTAGYILSFLPKGAFKVITDLVPPPGHPAARSFIAPPQGPPPSFKEPIAAESSLLPVVKKVDRRRKERGRRIYNSDSRDWNRMDTYPDLFTSDNHPQAREDKGFLEKLGEGLASLFGVGSPIARASEEIGLTNIFSSLASFWENNFAWGTGKFSPKVIIERQSHGREGELVLNEEESQPLISVIDLAEEGLGEEEEAEEPLMVDHLRPPPPTDYYML